MIIGRIKGYTGSLDCSSFRVKGLGFRGLGI